MKLTVATKQISGDPPKLDYCWDADTSILGARLSREHPDAERAPAATDGIVQIVSPDGAFMHFEIAGGRMTALEIALWPELAPSRSIKLPEPEDGYAEVSFVARGERARAGAVVGLTLLVQAVPDFPARTMQLRFGAGRSHRAVRAADSLLVGTDHSGRLASLWFLNVPGFAQTQP